MTGRGLYLVRCRAGVSKQPTECLAKPVPPVGPWRSLSALKLEAKADSRTDVLEIEISARQPASDPRPHQARIGI